MIRDAVLLDHPERSALRVAGLPLGKRTALALARAGVRRLVVVGAPPPAAELDPADPEYARAGLTVEVVAGASLADARATLAGPVLVSTCAGVFEPGSAARLAAAAPAPGEVVELAPTGLVAAGAEVRDLAAATSRRRLDPGPGAVALAVTDAASARGARRAMMRALRKPTDGWVSRHLNRYVSLFVTGFILDTRITPNQMTVVATAVGVAGVWFTLQASWLGVALGATLVQLQSILDGCDGEIARLKFKSSKLGEWLDNVLDDHVNLGFGVALAWATGELTGAAIWGWLGVAIAACMLPYYALTYLQLALVHRSGNPTKFRWWFQKDGAELHEVMQRPSLGARIGELFRSLARRDVFLLVFMLVCLARLPQVAVVWYAVIAAGYLAMTVIHVLAGGMPERPGRTS
jgi:phosphatidylglycerophosphate synthase